MAVFRPPAGLNRNLLAEHLARLTETLEHLDERLRDGIASAIGQTIASAIREALLVLLSQETDAPRFPPRYQERASTWDDRDRRMYADDPEAERYWWEEQEEQRWPTDRTAPERLGPQEVPQAEAKPRRWISALAAGWQAATWWLRKPPRRFQVLTAVGVGLAVAAVALVAGPFAGAGLGVVGTSVGLLAMSTSARSGAARLADLAAE